MGCTLFGVNTLWLADPDAESNLSQLCLFVFSQTLFPTNSLHEPCASSKPHYATRWYLFFSHFSTVPISLPDLLLPPLSCPNSRFLSAAFSATSQLSQRNLPLLSTTIALYTSRSLYLSYLYLCFTFQRIFAWWHGHYVIYSHLVNCPVQSLQHILNEWLNPTLVLMLSQFVMACFSLLPTKTSCHMVSGLVSVP